MLWQATRDSRDEEKKTQVSLGAKEVGCNCGQTPSSFQYLNSELPFISGQSSESHP
jgi:hypothetical protein